MRTTVSSPAWKREGLLYFAAIRGTHCTIQPSHSKKTGEECFVLVTSRPGIFQRTEHLAVDQAKAWAEENA